MTFKIGDEVKVKEGLKFRRYGRVSFVNGMEHLCGETVTITNVGVHNYSIEDNDYSWSEEMFEPSTIDNWEEIL